MCKHRKNVREKDNLPPRREALNSNNACLSSGGWKCRASSCPPKSVFSSVKIVVNSKQNAAIHRPQVTARERPGASGLRGSSVRCRRPGSRPLLGPPYLHHEFGSQPISSFPCDAGVGAHLRATAPLPWGCFPSCPPGVSSSFLWSCFRKPEDGRPLCSVEVHSGGCGFDGQGAASFSCLLLWKEAHWPPWSLGERAGFFSHFMCQMLCIPLSLWSRESGWAPSKEAEPPQIIIFTWGSPEHRPLTHFSRGT